MQTANQTPRSQLSQQSLTQSDTQQTSSRQVSDHSARCMGFRTFTQQVVRALVRSRCKIFNYQFVIKLVAGYLDDDDVLCGILPTNTEAIRSLTGFRLASAVAFVNYRSTRKHLQVELTRLKITINPVLQQHLYLRSAFIEFTDHAQQLHIGMLPVSLTELTIVGLFNQQLVPGMLPDRLQILRMGRHFNQPILPAVLPVTLRELVLNLPYHVTEIDTYLGREEGEGYNQPFVVGSLPAGLTSLSLTESFQQRLNYVLPAGLVNLVLSHWYSFSIDPDVLPGSLKSLEMGFHYGTRLEAGVLPFSLEKIRFNHMPDNGLYGVIPSSVRELTFEPDTNLIPGWIPFGVKHVQMHMSTLPLRVGIFPTSLEKLVLGSLLCPIDVGVLPSSLKLLEFRAGSPFDHSIGPGVLPDSLTYLDLGEKFNQLLSPGVLPSSLAVLRAPGYKQQLCAGCLPSQLTYLCLDSFEGEVPCDLPASLEVLVTKSEHLLRRVKFGLQELIFLGRLSSRLTPGMIPPSVTKLDLGTTDASLLLPGSIPSSVTHLIIRCCISVPQVIPPSVTHLEVLAKSGSNSTVSGYSLVDVFQRFVLRDAMPIPSSVTHLRFGDYMTSPLMDDMIPSSVTHIAFGKLFDQPIASSSLISRLECIILPKKYPHLASLYPYLHIRPSFGKCSWAEPERLIERPSKSAPSDDAQNEPSRWVVGANGRWMQLEE